MVNNANYESAYKNGQKDYNANPYAYHNPHPMKSKAWNGYDDGWMDAQWDEVEQAVKDTKKENGDKV